MSLSYDVHTHVGLDLGFYLAGWWPYACTAQELVHRLDQASIDRAVCFPFCLPSAFDPNAFAANRSVKLMPNRVPFDVENKTLIIEIERLNFSDRLLPFAMFDPGRCVNAQLKCLEKIVDRIVGLKTQTTVLKSPISDLLSKADGFMTLARKHDIPVLIHTAVSPEDHWAQVADCLAVARCYPEVRFNLAHSLRFHARHLETAARLPNVWVDCSAHLTHCSLTREESPIIAPQEVRVKADPNEPVRVLEAVHTILGDCYLWGSDYPFSSWCSDSLTNLNSYAEETSVLQELDRSIRISMTQTAPNNWLFGWRILNQPCDP